MSTTVSVTPCRGHYLVSVRANGRTRSERVDREKRCSCGGTRQQPCLHVWAACLHLQAGGQRAGETARPAACPICGEGVVHGDPGLWRCPADPSHYWQWRGERNGGAVRRFLTQPHPNKEGPFYQMTLQEREAFLQEARRRMHAGGYTPHA